MIPKGKDKFGEFLLVKGICTRCSKEGPCIKYIGNKFKLPDEVESNEQLAGKSAEYHGLMCGCYATFHRHVTHIRENTVIA